MTFDELQFETSRFGKRARVSFANGYGASVVQNAISYGNKLGLYELGVLHNNKLCYDTPITHDVIGFLSPEMVTKLLVDIETLPPKLDK